MNEPRFKRTVLRLGGPWMLGLLVVGGCGSMAKNASEAQIIQIEIGKTTKSDVLNLIGLPHQTERQTAQGGGQIHRWIYLKSPDLSVLFGGVFTGHVATDRRLRDRKDIVAVIEFSEDGLVTDLLLSGGES